MPTLTLDPIVSVPGVQKAVSQIRVLKKNHKPVDIIRKFRRENITTSHCMGTVGAGSINRAAMELGLISKPKPGSFFNSYRVTKWGKELGVSANGRSVRYSDAAVSLLRGFFAAKTHINHGFVAH